MATTKKQTAQAAEEVGTAVIEAPAQGGALALPSALMEKLAAQAKEEAAKERPSVSKLSIKSGILQYEGQAVPGNELDVFVAASSFINTWYPGRYDPNNIVNPACFAMALNEEDLEAHEIVPDENVPGETRACSDCPHAEWESNPEGGRGKWCKEKRRLALLPAAAEDLVKAEIATLDLPVTSVKNWGTFVNQVAASVKVPVHCVLTRVKVVPDAKSQFKVTFTPLRVVNEAEYNAIEQRRDEAINLVLQPYDEVGPKEVQVAPPASRRGKF